MQKRTESLAADLLAQRNLNEHVTASLERLKADNKGLRERMEGVAEESDRFKETMSRIAKRRDVLESEVESATNKLEDLLGRKVTERDLEEPFARLFRGVRDPDKQEEVTRIVVSLLSVDRELKFLRTLEK